MGGMSSWFFASDLHGEPRLYKALLQRVADEPPAAVLLGGDLLPGGLYPTRTLDAGRRDFIHDFLVMEFERLRARLGPLYPRVVLILGNDDPRFQEAAMLAASARGLWQYIHGRRVAIAGFPVYGYSFVPPSPFLLKDWERYDVSRYVEPGCTSPEEGLRSVPMAESERKYATIADDLVRLVGEDAMDRAVLLFHAPPYDTALDRAALDGRSIDHVPLRVHVGSVAMRRWIERAQPLLTLHGHVHESARLTGQWRDRIGRTHCLSAAHDGPELALVRFDPADPAAARRELL